MPNKEINVTEQYIYSPLNTVQNKLICVSEHHIYCRQRNIPNKQICVTDMKINSRHSIVIKKQKQFTGHYTFCCQKLCQMNNMSLQDRIFTPVKNVFQIIKYMLRIWLFTLVRPLWQISQYVLQNICSR